MLLVEFLEHDPGRHLEELRARRGPRVRLNRTPQHDEVLRVLKEIAEAAFVGFNHEAIGNCVLNALPGENLSLLCY